MTPPIPLALNSSRSRVMPSLSTRLLNRHQKLRDSCWKTCWVFGSSSGKGRPKHNNRSQNLLPEASLTPAWSSQRQTSPARFSSLRAGPRPAVAPRQPAGLDRRSRLQDFFPCLTSGQGQGVRAILTFDFRTLANREPRRENAPSRGRPRRQETPFHGLCAAGPGKTPGKPNDEDLHRHFRQCAR